MSENSADVFDLDRIRSLVELMKENGVSEIDLEDNGQRVKLTRGVASAPAAAPVVASAPVETVAPVVETTAAPAKPEQDDSKFTKTINSPMVGTFYASPRTDKPPFVKVGDVVAPDKTVCIIEAMKVFNEVQAETSGKIVAVLVKNGDMVEYGTPLFKVDVRG
ncbi:MAG: acetyl-CoA carboxylase biotin carboxyl carrier protein [Thermoguttaceae bacterium]|nr:acetyl-CoA carboxylase biotin carboxyl carrier protein [Thermoguttaceae bacterium]